MVASADKARDELGWAARRGLDEMCAERLVGLAGVPAGVIAPKARTAGGRRAAVRGDRAAR